MVGATAMNGAPGIAVTTRRHTTAGDVGGFGNVGGGLGGVHMQQQQQHHQQQQQHQQYYMNNHSNNSGEDVARGGGGSVDPRAYRGRSATDYPNSHQPRVHRNQQQQQHQYHNSNDELAFDDDEAQQYEYQMYQQSQQQKGGGYNNKPGSNNSSTSGSDNPENMKLFIGQIPRDLDEEGLEKILGEYGNIRELVVLRDRHGLSRGCAFCTFSTLIEAHNAVQALHQEVTLDGMGNALQVKFADVATEKPENKLFVGMIPLHVAESDLKSIFGAYGTIKEVALLRNSSTGVSRGCAFIKFVERVSAEVAVEDVNGKMRLTGSKQALVVKFAYSGREKQLMRAKQQQENNSMAAAGLQSNNIKRDRSNSSRGSANRTRASSVGSSPQMRGMSSPMSGPSLPDSRGYMLAAGGGGGMHHMNAPHQHHHQQQQQHMADGPARQQIAMHGGRGHQQHGGNVNRSPLMSAGGLPPQHPHHHNNNHPSHQLNQQHAGSMHTMPQHESSHHMVHPHQPGMYAPQHMQHHMPSHGQPVSAADPMFGNNHRNMNNNGGPASASSSSSADLGSPGGSPYAGAMYARRSSHSYGGGGGKGASGSYPLPPSPLLATYPARDGQSGGNSSIGPPSAGFARGLVGGVPPQFAHQQQHGGSPLVGSAPSSFSQQSYVDHSYEQQGQGQTQGRRQHSRSFGLPQASSGQGNDTWSMQQQAQHGLSVAAAAKTRGSEEGGGRAASYSDPFSNPTFGSQLGGAAAGTGGSNAALPRHLVSGGGSVGGSPDLRATVSTNIASSPVLGPFAGGGLLNASSSPWSLNNKSGDASASGVTKTNESKVTTSTDADTSAPRSVDGSGGDATSGSIAGVTSAHSPGSSPEMQGMQQSFSAFGFGSLSLFGNNSSNRSTTGSDGGGADSVGNAAAQFGAIAVSPPLGPSAVPGSSGAGSESAATTATAAAPVQKTFAGAVQSGGRKESGSVGSAGSQ